MFFSPTALALIGGQVDSAERYRSVVSILGDSIRCSGTKISAHVFLTAAHCVVDTGTGDLAKEFLPGRPILVSNLVQPGGRSDYREVKVDSVRLHPSYREALERFFKYKEEEIQKFRGRYTGRDLEQRIRLLEANNHFSARSPDIAVISVREQTADIPAASIDCRPLSREEPVHLVGYGIEGFRKDSSTHPTAPKSRRKWAETQVIRVDTTNFYTYAHLKRAGTPSLAPGDSGGPVMRDGRIVGVNGTVYGLHPIEAARSNMSVNLNGLSTTDGKTGQQGCRAFFGQH